MFEAQAKYFNLNADKALATVNTLMQGNQVQTENLKAVLDFVNQVKEKMSQHGFTSEYRLNHQFAKYALKRCRKDFAYIKAKLKGEFKTYYEK